MLSKSILAAVFAAITTVNAKDFRTHGVGYFWSGPTVEARMDPIISPGMQQSQHVHTVFGGNGFSVDMSDDAAADSTCTGSNVVADKSSYWFPKLFFQDPKTKKFEAVSLYLLKAYYFFEATDDEIKPFPKGFRMVSGNPFARSNYYKNKWTGNTVLPNEINPVSWHCKGVGNNLPYKGLGPNGADNAEGPGFPNIKCNEPYVPLASFIHFPSCADLSQPFTNFSTNTVWPTQASGQKSNCPKGYTHLPHLFLEIQWNTPDFDSRWDPATDKQPFVLAQGDDTGFGGHADFISGWDEDVLSHLINTCDADSSHGDGLDSCPGIQNFDTGAHSTGNVHPQTCTVQAPVPIDLSKPLDALPGCNPVQSGPQDAKMCDCSSGTPVCNGVMMGGGGSGSGSASGSGTVSSSASAPKSTATTMVTSSAPAPTSSGAEKGQSGGNDGGDDGDEGDDGDDDECDAPEN